MIWIIALKKSAVTEDKDDIETIFVINIATIKTIKANSEQIGLNAKKTPAVQATPFPPLN